ncbi:MAG: HTTM domain-containing protein, partial [Verrucomicrobia bacterium]|nr:HTTM domain-containing protein [Verrucomicrobiota bacterium]
MMNSLQRIISAQISARVLGVVRLGIGLAAVIRAIIGWQYLDAVLNPQNIRMPNFECLPQFPYAYVDILGALWLVVSLLFLVGFYTRTAGVLLTIIIGFVIGIDYQLYASHLYLLAILCFLLALGNSGKAYSIDSWRCKSSGEVILLPLWPAQLMMIQVSIVYAFAGLSKLNPGFLSGMLIYPFLRQDGFFAFPEQLQTVVFLPIMAAAAVLT